SNTSPPRVTAYVDHRRKHPIQSIGTCFDCRDACTSLYGFEIPACRHTQGNRENSTVSVDHVEAKQQRYSKARFVDSHFLEFPHCHRCIDVEYTTYQTAFDFLFDILTHNRTGNIKADGDKIQLADLFLERHLAEQAVDKGGHFAVATVRFTGTLLRTAYSQRGYEYCRKYFLSAFHHSSLFGVSNCRACESQLSQSFLDFRCTHEEFP